MRWTVDFGRCFGMDPGTILGGESRLSLKWRVRGCTVYGKLSGIAMRVSATGNIARGDSYATWTSR